MAYRFINMEYLDSVSGGDTEIIREIVGIFRTQVVEIYDDMVLQYTSRNFKDLGLLAHKAKSSVAIMGMTDLATMLKNFELLAKEEKETGLYESYIKRFREETEEAIKELEQILNSR